MKFLALLLLLPMLAHAGMEFASTIVKATAKLEDESVDFLFKFKITGDQPLVIKDLEVSCGCLEATANKTQYAAGESGEVKVVMKVGSVEGESTKYITVTTDDAAHPNVQLDCSVNVPKLYEFTPMTTTWEIGDACTAKQVRIKVLGAEPINILKYASTRPNMAADMQVVTAGREYLLTLTPKSTEQPELGLVTLETDCKISKYSKRQLFFTIVRKRLPTPIPPSK